MTKFVKNNGLPIHYKATSNTVSLPDTASRIASAYYASFNTIDAELDIIRKGAFLKSINDRGPASTSNRQIKFLHQHNIQEPCATFVSLREDNNGLKGEHKIENTPLGDIIIERYANGIYKEHSFGFQYVWDKCNWIDVPNDEDEEKTTEAFECKELNLFECSVVTFGCNENTPFLGFKGTNEDLVKQLESELSFLIKNAPNYEYELSLRQLYAKQISFAKELVANNTKELSKPIIAPKENLSFYSTLI
jgi:HK97 family phage prohead protease